MRRRLLRSVSLVSISLLFAGGCSKPPEAPVDGGVTGEVDAGTAVDAGADGGTADAGLLPVTVGADGGSFVVPATGAAVSFASSGTTFSMTIPGSAAGQAITIAPSDSAAVGWPAGTFSDVIKLEPDGASFDPPILIQPANKQVLLFSTKVGSGKSAIEPLALSPDGKGFQLSHFSALVMLPPGKSCDSTSGWNSEPNNEVCRAYAGEATTRISYGCKGYSFCTLIFAECCVTAADLAARPDRECRLGDRNLSVQYQFASNGNAYCLLPDGGEPARPACPSALNYVDGGSGGAACKVTAAVGDDTYGFDCDRNRFDGGVNTVCTCLVNGAAVGSSSVNYCADVPNSFKRCASRVCQ